MSNPNTFHCIVDDTTLTTNLDEIGPWVQNGAVNLVVPLCTLERLHLLKKDASQLGQCARRAVKLLDQSADLSHNPITIQGFEDQYLNWSEVEKRYTASVLQPDDGGLTTQKDNQPIDGMREAEVDVAVSASPEKMLNDLSLSSEELKSSPVSTPPLSPSTSELQSAKTSPEVRCASVTKHEATPVPPTLKPLINYVVWYTYESEQAKKLNNLIFLTNSADAAQIAKDFNIVPKTIHQLRASISGDAGSIPAENGQPKTKKTNRATSFKDDANPRTLFRYDEASSEDEELVFKPRSRDQPRPGSSGRGNNNGYRGRGAMHSPSNSINTQSAPKPQVPVEEIDPDSFDRGTFARGSTPLANVGNFHGPSNNSPGRGGSRNFSSPMPRGGGRGNTFRGRGRGRLFVP